MHEQSSRSEMGNPVTHRASHCGRAGVGAGRQVLPLAVQPGGQVPAASGGGAGSGAARGEAASGTSAGAGGPGGRHGRSPDCSAHDGTRDTSSNTTRREKKEKRGKSRSIIPLM